MLKIFDQNKSPLGYISKIKDVTIESDLENSDKTLSFTYCVRKGGKKILNEFYVETETDRYVVKEVSESSDGYPTFNCELDLEDLERNMFLDFTHENSTVLDAARLAVAGTGWRVESDVTRIRTVQQQKVNSLTILKAIRDAFFCEMKLDAKNKVVYFYDEMGDDRGVYLMSGLNLKKMSASTDSRDYYTRLIPIGKDDLRIDGDYVENHQYSNKIRELIWEDTTYEDAAELKADAIKKLQDVSKPRTSYSVTIDDLAKRSKKYKAFEFKLGDKVTLIDTNTGTRDKQRIVKITEHPDNPENNTAEIANTFYHYHEKQEAIQRAMENYESISDSSGSVKSGIYVHGTMDGSKIAVEVGNYSTGGSSGGSGSSGGGYSTDLNSYATSVSGQISGVQEDMNIVKAAIGTLDVTYLKATEADIKYATIENLNAVDVRVHSIEGDYADFKTVTANEISAQAGIIDALSGDFASYKTTMAQDMIAAKGWMAEGSIGDAQIQSLSANKLSAGTIDTAVVTVGSKDGKSVWKDNTIQFSDANRVRVQIGKDASGDYTLALWDASGKQIWDAKGITADGIQRKIIRDDMVADNANISAFKLNIPSVVESINGGTTKIVSTIVSVGDKTLDAAFSEQTQTIAGQTELLSTHTSKISANETAIKQKVSTETYNKDTAANTSHFESIDGSISAMQDAINLKVSQTEIDASLEGYSTTAQTQGLIDVAKGEIRQSVSDTYATKSAVGELETWRQAAEQKISKEGIIATVQEDYFLLKSDEVASSITEYYLSGSKTGLSGGTWSEVRSDIPDGKYLWARSKVTYNDGTVRYTDERCISDSDKAYVVVSTPDGCVLRTGESTTLTADVMVNGKPSDKTYSYIWYIKKDGAEQYSRLGIGKTISVPASTFTGQAEIYCAAGGYNDFYYLDESGNILTDENGNKFTGSSVLDFPMDSNIYDFNRADNVLSQAMTRAIQAIDRFRWVVKGESEASFELTDRVATLVAEQINLRGLVTFSAFDKTAQDKINGISNTASSAKTAADNAKSVADSAKGWVDTNGTTATSLASMAKKWTGASTFTNDTKINGAYIQTGTITADQIAAGTITAAEIDVSNLFAQNIAATGTISGVTLSGATGSFSGTVNASEFKINNNKLSFGSAKLTMQGVSDQWVEFGTGDVSGDNRLVYNLDSVISEDTRDCLILETSQGLSVPGVAVFGTIGASVGCIQDLQVGGTARFATTIEADDIVVNRDVSLTGVNRALKNKLDKSGGTITGSLTVTGQWDSTTELKVFGNVTSDAWVSRVWGGGIYRSDSTYVRTDETFYAPTIHYTAIKNISDERAKNILGSVDERFEKAFMELKPITYTFKNDKSGAKRIGLGAQTTEAIFAENGINIAEYGIIQRTYFDTEVDGMADRYTIDYQDVSMLAAWMTQKNTRRIAELESQVSALQKEIMKLRNRASA